MLLYAIKGIFVTEKKPEAQPFRKTETLIEGFCDKLTFIRSLKRSSARQCINDYNQSLLGTGTFLEVALQRKDLFEIPSELRQRFFENLISLAQLLMEDAEKAVKEYLLLSDDAFKTNSTEFLEVGIDKFLNYFQKIKTLFSTPKIDLTSKENSSLFQLFEIQLQLKKYSANLSQSKKAGIFASIIQRVMALIFECESHNNLQKIQEIQNAKKTKIGLILDSIKSKKIDAKLKAKQDSKNVYPITDTELYRSLLEITHVSECWCEMSLAVTKHFEVYQIFQNIIENYLDKAEEKYRLNSLEYSKLEADKLFREGVAKAKELDIFFNECLIIKFKEIKFHSTVLTLTQWKNVLKVVEHLASFLQNFIEVINVYTKNPKHATEEVYALIKSVDSNYLWIQDFLNDAIEVLFGSFARHNANYQQWLTEDFLPKAFENSQKTLVHSSLKSTQSMDVKLHVRHYISKEKFKSQEFLPDLESLCVTNPSLKLNLELGKLHAIKLNNINKIFILTEQMSKKLILDLTSCRRAIELSSPIISELNWIFQLKFLANESQLLDIEALYESDLSLQACYNKIKNLTAAGLPQLRDLLKTAIDHLFFFDENHAGYLEKIREGIALICQNDTKVGKKIITKVAEEISSDNYFGNFIKSLASGVIYSPRFKKIIKGLKSPLEDKEPSGTSRLTSPGVSSPPPNLFVSEFSFFSESALRSNKTIKDDMELERKSKINRSLQRRGSLPNLT